MRRPNHRATQRQPEILGFTFPCWFPEGSSRGTGSSGCAHRWNSLWGSCILLRLAKELEWQMIMQSLLGQRRPHLDVGMTLPQNVSARPHIQQRIAKRNTPNELPVKLEPEDKNKPGTKRIWANEVSPFVHYALENRFPAWSNFLADEIQRLQYGPPSRCFCISKKTQHPTFYILCSVLKRCKHFLKKERKNEKVLLGWYLFRHVEDLDWTRRYDPKNSWEIRTLGNY